MCKAMRVPPMLILLILFAASPAGGAEREWHRYRAICEKLSLDTFAALPESQRDRLDIRLKLTPAEGPQVPVTLTIVTAAGRIVVPSGPDGLSSFPVRPDLLAEDPIVLTSVPEPVKTKVSMELVPRLPPERSFPYAELLGSVEQANRVIKAAAGLLGFAAPRMKGVVLQFPAGAAPATAKVGEPDGRLLSADADGRINLLLDAKLLATNPEVVLSVRPTSGSFTE